jgi:hypothetical protein
LTNAQNILVSRAFLQTQPQRLISAVEIRADFNIPASRLKGSVVRYKN